MEAVGVAFATVSLAIDLCHGLFEYYDSWKEADSNIDTLLRYVSSVKGNLELVKRLDLTQGNSSDVKQRLFSIENVLRRNTDRLEKKLDKVTRNNGASSLRGRVSKQLDRFSYPFKESTIAKLKEIVTDLQDNVHFILQIASFETGQMIKHELVHTRTAVQGIQSGMASVQLGSQTIQHEVGQTRREVQNVQDSVDTVQRGIGAAHLDLKVAANHVTNLHFDATHDRIHRWLRETDPSTNHHMARDKREAGTGRWFFNTPHWQRWLTDKNSLLWLHGQAGCGKTVLSSTIVEEVRRFAKTQPNSATAYFYFDFRDSKKQQLRPCLASLASQLSWHRSVPSELKALHGDCNGAPASADDLQTVLVSITRTTGPAYIILDALDECPLDNNERSRDQVLDWLDAIKRESFTNLHVLCTSRNEPDIEQVLKTDLSATTLAIQGEEVKADIRRYIHAQLEKHKRLRTLDEQVKEEIQKSLTSRAGGMFRWVFCQMNDLQRLRIMTPDSVRRTLKRLPKTLDETYARILMNIGEDEQPIVRRALRWLVFSERDLTIDELAEASIIDLEREHCIDTSERFTPGDLLHALSGLVTTAFPGDAFGIEDASYNDLKDACKDEVEGETTLQLVRLAHFSVKEYLLSDRLGTSCLNKYALDTSECTLFLTKSCLAYIEHVMRSRLDTWLNTDGWKETWAQNSNTSWTKNYRICCGQFPLLPYATRMWYRHQRRHLGQDESLQIIDSIIHKFYTDLELNWKWLSLVTLAHTVRESVPLLHTYYFRLEPSDYYREAQRSGISIWGAALVSASVFGLVSVVEFCLARGDLIAGTLELSLDISVGAPGYNDIGHATDNIRLLGALLAVGVYRVDNGQAALYKAIEGGDDAVICLLLENGAVLDRELRPSSIPIRYRWRYGLELACASGCSIQILSLLIEHGADIERGSHCTPLVNAICHRRIDAARLLLEHGADVEHAMSSRIPLHEACKVGYADMVELLLEHGAAVNRVSQENDLVGALVGDLVGLGSSALSIAARHGATSSIESLARHGADLQHCNSEGFNALQSAFSCGSHYYSTDVVFSRETATMLLKLGLDPTIHKVYPRSWALDSMLQWVVQQALEICMVPADAWLQEPDHHAVYQAYSKLVLAGASVEDCQAVVIEHLQTTWQECFDLMLSKNALLTLEDGSTMLARDRAFELGEAGNEKLLRLLIVNGMRKSEAETRSPKAQRKLKYSNHYAMAGFDDMLGRIEEEG